MRARRAIGAATILLGTAAIAPAAGADDPDQDVDLVSIGVTYTF